MRSLELPESFSMEVLSDKTLEEARQLCDKHVGKGLYDASFFEHLPSKAGHQFYLLSHEGNYIGYFYCLWMPSISQMPDLDVSAVRKLIPHGRRVGVCRSIGIDKEYRGLGLSDLLLNFFTAFLFEEGCVAVLVPAWKKAAYIPAKRHLEACGFFHLCDLQEPWKTHQALHCPFCRSNPCTCDAVLYYKLEEEHETK